MGKYLTSPPATEHMPGGVPYIIGNEAAERFSFYGMRAILFIFMTKYLMSIDGDGRAVMGDEEATGWYHMFVSAVYFFPIVGAVVSDLFLGKYKTILWLSIVYCLGHLALALDESRIGLTLGLTLIAIGSGGIKPCVSAHVGDQFGSLNHHLLPRVFSWFYFSINFGAFLSTLATPWLLEKYGPSVAFGVPGGLMLLATIVFWMGRNVFVHIPAGGVGFLKETFSGEGLTAILNLTIIYILIAPFWALFDQTGSAWISQAERMNRVLPLFDFSSFQIVWEDVLSSQIQTANPILILLLIPVFSYIVYPVMGVFFKVTPLRKMSIGMFVMVAAFLVVGYVETQITGGQVVHVKSFLKGAHGGSELIDGEAGQSAWISIEDPKFPQEIIIRLRERSAWEVNKVRFRLEASHENQTENCRPKAIAIFAANSRKGPWRKIAETALKRDSATQVVALEPTKTEYVKIEVHSNWGGPVVAISEVEVFAATSLPADAHPHAEAVWPNVAAMGHKPHVVWQLFAYVILTAAEVLVSITCLEFSYTQAPRKMKSFIMAIFLLSISLGNSFTSLVNFFIQNPDGTSKLEGPAYYWFFTAIMFITAVAFAIMANFYRGKTYIQEDEKLDHIEAQAEGTTME